MSNVWGTFSTNQQQNPYVSTVDLRRAMHDVIYGSSEFIKQGRPVILRELTDTVCPACWSVDDGNSKRSNCTYCDGEGYQFRERYAQMILFPGVAPVYKAGIFGTGQYPQAGYGYTDPTKCTIYCEWNVYPNYERYTLPNNQSADKLYEIKVDSTGNPIYTGSPLIPTRTAKWKLLSITPLFGDYGRVEYFEISAEKESIS